MFLKLNIKGKDANNLAESVFKKMPSKMCQTGMHKIEEVTKRHLSNNDIMILQDEEGSLYAREKQSLELVSFYTKYKPEEIEYTLMGIANALDYSINFAEYINIEVLRNAYNTKTDEFDISAEFGPIRSSLKEDFIVDILEEAGFTVETVDCKVDTKIEELNNYNIGETFFIKISKKADISTFIKQLHILVSVINPTKVNFSITKDYVDRVKSYSENWLRDYKYAGVILDRILGDSEKKERRTKAHGFKSSSHRFQRQRNSYLLHKRRGNNFGLYYDA